MPAAIEIPTLRTARLELRAFRAADWDAYAAMEARPEMREFRGGNLLTRQQAWTSMQFLLGQWPLRGYGAFAVASIEDGSFAGFAGVLHPADWPEPEVAWSIDTRFWGRGLAVEAASAAIRWAFAHVPLPELASFILSDNARSRRVAEKLGATREGTVDLRGVLADRWVHRRPGAGVTV